MNRKDRKNGTDESHGTNGERRTKSNNSNVKTSEETKTPLPVVMTVTNNLKNIYLE